MAFREMIARLALDNSAFQAGINSAIGGFDKLGQRASTMTKDLAASTQKMGAAMTQMGQTMSSFGSSATMSISAPLAGLATLAVQTSDKMATARIGFETMLASAAKADAFIRELADFAKRTPFDFPGLQSAAQRMLAMGFAAKEIIPIMTAVGNAVGNLGGGQDKIDRIVLAFGQMQAKGRVMAQEMNQLTEAGVKGWQYLADAIGKAQGRIVTVGEVMKMVEGRMLDGAAAVKIMAFSMEKEFAGGMEKASKLITGQLSNLRDSLVGPGGPLDQLGKALTPMVMGWIQSLQGLVPIVNSLIGQFTSLSPATQQFALQFAAIAVAIGPVTFGLSKLALVFGPLMTGISGLLSALSGIPAAFAAFAKFPIGWITGAELALVSLGAAVTVLAATLAVAKLETWAREQSDAFGDFVVAMTGPISIIPKLGDKFRELKAELSDWGSFLPAIKKDFDSLIERFVAGFLAIDKAVGGPISSFQRVAAGIRELFPDLEKLISLYRGVAAAKEVVDKITSIPRVALPPTALERTAIMGAAPGGAGAAGIATAELERMARESAAFKEAAGVKYYDELLKKLIRVNEEGKKIPTWQKQINDGWKEWDAAIESLRGKVRGMLEAFEETDIPREFLGPLADQLEQLGEQDLRKLQESLKQLMSQEQQIEDGWADWARETENLRGKIRGLADEFKALDIPAEFAGSLESLTTLSEEGLRDLEPVLERLIEQQKAINDGWADWAVQDAKVEASIQSLMDALEEFGVTMERTAGETLEGFKVRVESELVAQQQIAEGWKQLGEEEAREAGKISEVYRRFAQDMSSTFDRLGNDIARHITSLKGITDAFKDWALSIKDAILNLVINQALKPLKDFIETQIAPAIAKFITGTLGFSLPGAAGAAASGAAGAAGSAAGSAGGTAGAAGGLAGGAGGVLGAVTGIAGAAGSIAGAVMTAKVGADMARVEVTTRGMLAEALNLRADLWDQHGKLFSKLDDLFQFTWVKLDEIITSIRNWAGVGGGGGPVPAGSTTPGVPSPFEGGAGQLPRMREVGPEFLPYLGGHPPLSSSFPNSITVSNVPWGNPIPVPAEWEESIQGLMANVNQLSSSVAGAAAAVRIGDVIIRGGLLESMIPSVPGGHDAGGVGSVTAAYQAYYRALEEAAYGPRQRGTQSNPFGGGQGGVRAPGVPDDVWLNWVGPANGRFGPGAQPVVVNNYITIEGDLATEQQRRTVARELAQYVEEYRTTIRQI